MTLSTLLKKSLLSELRLPNESVVASLKDMHEKLEKVQILDQISRQELNISQISHMMSSGYIQHI